MEMALAEETGVIVDLGDWVMNKVCATAAAWARKGISQRLAINVSMRELAQPDFFARLRDTMQRHGVPPSQLELEITESVIMSDPLRSLQVLTRLTKMGRRLAGDEFGPG